MSVQLPTDQYYIRNAATNAFASRNQREDRSLNPKGVFSPPDGDPELWLLQALPNGRYILRARGAATGVINNLVYAFLIDEDRREEWVITRREDKDGRPLYTIETASGSGGWASSPDSESDNPQVAVHPIIATPSFPPHFLPHQLWNIQPLVD